MQEMTPVIVLDGHLKSALAAVRSLGKRDIPVVVGGERSTGMALHSRYVTHRFLYPSPLLDQSGFVRHVKAEAVRIGGKPLVYTFSDATYTALYMHRDELKEYVHIVYPDDRSVEIVFDKAATYSFARVHGTPTVETYAVDHDTDIERLKTIFAYPIVIKPRRSVSWREGKGSFGSASFVFSLDELRKKFTDLLQVHGVAPLVQKYTEGEEYGVELLAKEGVPYALTAHRRLRSLSPTGGASVLKETITSGDLYTELQMYAFGLTKALSWSGPIMFEFKIDSDTRKPLLMEINGRFWGSLPLSVFAGVDMPYLFYKACVENGIPQELVRGREGVVSRHFLGDLRNLLRVFFAHDPMRSRVYPKRLRALSDFLHIPKGTYADVWNSDDMAPMFFEVFDIAKKSLWK